MPRKMLQKITEDAWHAGIIVFVVLVAFEVLQRGFVSRFFNLSWIVLFLFAVSIVLLAVRTSPGKGSGLGFVGLQLMGVLAAAVVWVVLPESLWSFWRAVAAGGTLLVALLAVPLLRKE